MKFKIDVEKNSGILATLILVFMLVQLLYLADYQSKVNDEFENIVAGKYYVTNADFFPYAFRAHPPLGYMISNSFLYFDNNSIWSRTPHDSFYIFENLESDIHYIIFITRIPVALTALLLGIYVYRWSKELYGKKAALLALILYSFEPNVLAHFSIASTDFVVTAFIFIAMYYLWKFEKQQSLKSVLIAGIVLGLALISKHTALILIPIAGVFFLIYYKRRILEKQNLAKISVYFLVAFFVLWATYGFDVATVLETVHSKDTALEFVNKNYENEFERNLIDNAMNTPTPAAHYVTALGYRFYHKTTGNPYYFFGDISNTGRWDYYAIVFFLKTPIQLLIFLGIFITAIIFRKRRINGKDEKFLIFFILFYFVVMTFVISLNVGLRHMLPIYPFIFVLLGSLINLKFKKNAFIFKLIIVFLIIIYIINSLLFLPHNLSYFNEFIGPENAWHSFADGDIDLNQEMKGLRNYVEENGIQHIYVQNTNYNLLVDIYLKNYSFAGCETRNGIYAISVSSLTLYESRDCYKWLKEREPDDMIGYSMIIYNVTDAGDNK